MGNRKYLFALVLALALFSCKTRRAAETAGRDTGGAPARYHDLSARLHADLRAGGQEMSSPVELKMVRDSLVWLSVQPFLGIELFRLEATPDSVKALDRMGKRVCRQKISPKQWQSIQDAFANFSPDRTEAECRFRLRQAPAVLAWRYADFRPAGQGMFPRRMTASLSVGGHPAGELDLSVSQLEINKGVKVPAFPSSGKYREVTIGEIWGKLATGN